MKRCLIILPVILFSAWLLNAQELQLNGLNELSYIYRTAEDSLNSYFRDAFSFSLGYRNFSLGMKFLAKLPKYSTDQTQLLPDLSSDRLSSGWTERWLEYEKDNLILHGGTITESFAGGMVFRAWEDTEFDRDTRLDGLLIKYNQKLKLKAVYGALPNLEQPARNDLAYGFDAEYPLAAYLDLGASALTLRTLNALSVYNQQDVFGARANWRFNRIDGLLEYAVTSLFKNSGVNHEGTAVNASANCYLNPGFLQFLTLGAGYKYYDHFNYRTQDLKTFNYHNETLSDAQVTGVDEEGLQGSLAAGITEDITYNLNYAEAWDSSFRKRMSDFYTDLEWQRGELLLTGEYAQVEKLDKVIDIWQQEITPALSAGFPLGGYAVTAKAEYGYVEKVNRNVSAWHYEPMLQLDLGMGKVSVSVSAESQWQNSSDIIDGSYWANCEVRYPLFAHTDVTLFAGKEAGGKVCRNGICRYVAPFQGVRLEAVSRF
jgi:hypothetical protein